MTVRLSDESASYIDALVSEGTAPSRAAALDRLVRRERRRRDAENDALIYAAVPPSEEEEQAWAEWSSSSAAKVWVDLD